MHAEGRVKFNGRNLMIWDWVTAKGVDWMCHIDGAMDIELYISIVDNYVSLWSIITIWDRMASSSSKTMIHNTPLASLANGSKFTGWRCLNGLHSLLTFSISNTYGHS